MTYLSRCVGGWTEEKMWVERSEDGGEQQSAELASVKFGRGDLRYSNMQIMVLWIWRLPDKCHPFVLDLALSFISAQSRNFTCTIHSPTHNSTQTPVNWIRALCIGPSLLSVHSSAMWPYRAAWWKWSWFWCQLDWQGTWDVLVWEAEMTGLRLLYITDSTRVQIAESCCSQCEGEWSAPLCLILSLIL